MFDGRRFLSIGVCGGIFVVFFLELLQIFQDEWPASCFHFMRVYFLCNFGPIRPFLLFVIRLASFMFPFNVGPSMNSVTCNCNGRR